MMAAPHVSGPSQAEIGANSKTERDPGTPIESLFAQGPSNSASDAKSVRFPTHAVGCGVVRSSPPRFCRRTSLNFHLRVVGALLVIH
jgi:hypothetical protein